MVKILCLSDIHHSAKKNHGVYTDDPSVELRYEIGKDDFGILLSSIEKIAPIDLLVFCGDVIVGKDTDAQKKKSLEDIGNFIKKISSSKTIFRGDISNNWERIIYVPGNHDVDQNNFGELLEGVSNLFDKALSPMYDNTCTHEHAPIFIFDNLKLIVSVISTVDTPVTAVRR